MVMDGWGRGLVCAEGSGAGWAEALAGGPLGFCVLRSVTYCGNLLDMLYGCVIMRAYKFRSAVGLGRVVHPLFFYSALINNHYHSRYANDRYYCPDRLLRP